MVNDTFNAWKPSYFDWIVKVPCFFLFSFFLFHAHSLFNEKKEDRKNCACCDFVFDHVWCQYCHRFHLRNRFFFPLFRCDISCDKLSHGSVYAVICCIVCQSTRDFLFCKRRAFGFVVLSLKARHEYQCESRKDFKMTSLDTKSQFISYW